MKTALLSAALVLSLSSCDPSPTDKEVLADKIEAYLKPTMNDPASFELASIGDIDTVTMREYREGLARDAQGMIDSEKRAQERTSTLLAQPEGLRRQSDARIDRLKSEIDSLGALRDSADGDGIYAIRATCAIRGKNSVGALVLNNYLVTMNKAGEITQAKKVD